MYLTPQHRVLALQPFAHLQEPLSLLFTRTAPLAAAFTLALQHTSAQRPYSKVSPTQRVSPTQSGAGGLPAPILA